MEQNQLLQTNEKAITLIQNLYWEAISLEQKIQKNIKNILIAAISIGIVITLFLLLFCVGSFYADGQTLHYTISDALSHGVLIIGVCGGIGFAVGKGKTEKQKFQLELFKKELAYDSFTTLLPIYQPALEYRNASVSAVINIDKLYLIPPKFAILATQHDFYITGTIQNTPVQFYNLRIVNTELIQDKVKLEGIGISIPHQLNIAAPFLIKPSYKNKPSGLLHPQVYKEFNVSNVITGKPVTDKRFDNFMLNSTIICEDVQYHKNLLEADILSLYYELAITFNENIQLAVSKEFISIVINIEHDTFWKIETTQDKLNDLQRFNITKMNITLLENLFKTALQIQQLLPKLLNL